MTFAYENKIKYKKLFSIQLLKKKIQIDFIDNFR